MSVSQRPAVITAPILLGLFFGGGAAGVTLARAIAPDSLLAPFVGLLALPLAFATGMQLWLGLAVVSAAAHLLRRLVGRGSSSPPARARAAEVPPGSFAFVVTSTGISVVSGLLMGLLSTEYAFLEVLGAVALVGSLYGVGCWLLARSGYLPFFEGE